MDKRDVRRGNRDYRKENYKEAEIEYRKAIVKDSLGKITKAEIMAKCPDISKITVDRALKDMLDKGEVLKISGGRYTTYIWNREMN